MVRGTTQFAVALLLLVAGAGFPALAAVDGPDGATGGATTAAVTPLNETLTNSTGDTTNTINTTDEATDSTNETLTNTTDETTNTTDDTANTTNETLTNTTEDTTNTTEDATNTTNTTDDTTNATDGATNTTDSVTGATDEVTNTTDEMTDTVADVTNASAVTPLSDTSLRFSSTTLTVTSLSSSSSLLDDTLDSGVIDSSDPSGSTEQSSAERKDEAANEATTDTGERRTTTTTSSASTEDRTGGRDGIIPEGASEAMVGMSALTAAALVPQLADVLALVGNAGGLLSASSAFAGSTSGGRRGLRSRVDRLWRFVTPFRYSRWDDSDPLDHEIREALYETVECAPGAYLSEVCDRADVALSTARHHLNVLEDEGLVTTAKIRGKRRYYPDHAPDVKLTAALEDEGTAKVLHALARLGASHGGRLADELDRDASTVSHHLSRLEDAGLVEREREGRAVVNRLAPEVQAVLRGDGETDAETPAVAD